MVNIQQIKALAFVDKCNLIPYSMNTFCISSATIVDPGLSTGQSSDRWIYIVYF